MPKRKYEKDGLEATSDRTRKTESSVRKGRTGVGVHLALATAAL
jgi:uncharacterized protein YcgI (DUF1989 family)